MCKWILSSWHFTFLCLSAFCFICQFTPVFLNAKYEHVWVLFEIVIACFLGPVYHMTHLYVVSYFSCLIPLQLHLCSHCCRLTPLKDNPIWKQAVLVHQILYRIAIPFLFCLVSLVFKLILLLISFPNPFIFWL